MRNIAVAAAIGIASTALLVGAVTWVRAQGAPNRPPGVAAANWIDITDSVGILITSTRSPDRRPFDGPDGRTSGTLRAEGRLMALHNGVWLEFDELGSRTPRILPAH